MTMLNILIADDEAPARNRLRDLISDIADVMVVAEAQNGKDAVELAEQHAPDLILLDIRMPVPPKLIFTTAYDAYAIKAFELNAIDYLLKPIRQERLEAALNKVRVLLPEQVEALKPLQTVRTHLSIHERGRIILVPLNDVIYFRAEQKYVTVRTAEREFLVEDSLTQLEVEFGDRLLRLHRNCLVAKPFITGFEKRTILNDEAQTEQQWVAILRGVPETISVSRRQQHLIKTI
jgi:two-component system, LytTR family, response regulator AlgR